MSDVLTPQLALAYLAELQPSLRAVAILDDAGRLLAGDEPGEGPSPLTIGRDGYAIRAAAGTGVAPGARLQTLTRLDLENALADLAGPPGVA
jgi:hypothetical protein